MTTKRQFEFSEDTAAALDAIDAIAAGRGWCNVSPEVSADDVTVLAPSVFSLRAGYGAPVATYVTLAPKPAERRAGTLGVLHMQRRLGAQRIAELLDGERFAVRQDHNNRGLLLDVPLDTTSRVVLAVTLRLLAGLCDFERTGRWRMDVFERG